MNSQIPFTLKAILIALVLLSWATDIPASQPTSGEISLQFQNPPMPSGPWNLSIRVKTYLAFENGFIRLRLKPNRGSADEIRLWEGHAAERDTFAFEYELQPPSPGLYMLGVALVPYPEGPHGTFATHSIWYINITADTVFLARSSDWENLRNEILYDARERGLGDINPNAFDSLAPDLAKRWYDLYHPKSIETIEAESQSKANRDSMPPVIDVSDRTFFGPDRDTIAFPGSGPPPSKPTPDAVRARFPQRGRVP
jgi:hypothetical protein